VKAPDDNFAHWCEEQLGLTGARIERELSGGNSNLTQLVVTDQRPLVMRSPPANTISPKAHKGVEREFTVMRALRGYVPVPEAVAWCEDATIIGHPFALVEHIHGVSISDELPHGYAGAAAVNALGEQLTDALASLATAPWRELGLAGFGNPDNFLLRQIDRWLAVRAESSVRQLPQIEQLGQWLKDNLPQDGPAGIVHGDFHLDNTLCDPDRPQLLAVIDWEMASIGDPLADLGLFLMFWGNRRTADPPGFAHVQAVTRLQGTVDRRTLAARWASASGLSIDRLDFYLCFAFLRLAAIVEGAYGLFVRGKVDTPYARGLEYDVPALLEEAARAAQGDW
jgi:aminoglycoside phosphotransferase (APT) family kinase protein